MGADIIVILIQEESGGKTDSMIIEAVFYAVFQESDSNI